MTLAPTRAAFYNQELATIALRKEAASLLSDAAYQIKFKDAGISEVRELMDHAIEALEMSLPRV